MTKEWMQYYDVSETGVVKSLDREYINSRGQLRKVKSHILTTRPDRYGYEKVALCCAGKRIDTTVGILVAQKYIPNPDNHPEVNHKNENPMDNNVENLEWCTRLYNARYGTRTERSARTRSIPIIAIDLDGNEIYYPSASEAGRVLNLHQGNISACLRGEAHHTGGYYFKYADRGKWNG